MVANQTAVATAIANQRNAAQTQKATWLASLAKRPAAAAGAYCGDGNLYLAFLSVGQGDCTVISTPEGNVVLIDCGSDSMGGVAPATFVQNLQAILTDIKFMGTSNRIDILITTHPDTDHYNKLAAVLGKTCKITTWYHSADRIAYAAAQTSAYLATAVIGGVGGAQQVVYSNDPAGGVPGKMEINGSAPSGTRLTDPVLLASGGIRILKEATSGCEITILAGGVDHDYENDTATPDNRGSIVTLIEFGGKKVLICGDATRSTERFMLNKAGVNTKIQNVNVVQIGHHASNRTSSLPAFVQRVNPIEKAIGSAGDKIPLHKLPSKEVLDRYETQMRNAGRAPVAAHNLGCWENQGTAAGIVWAQVPYTQDVYTTGNGLIEVTIP